MQRHGPHRSLRHPGIFPRRKNERCDSNQHAKIQDWPGSVSLAFFAEVLSSACMRQANLERRTKSVLQPRAPTRLTGTPGCNACSIPAPMSHAHEHELTEARPTGDGKIRSAMRSNVPCSVVCDSFIMICGIVTIGPKKKQREK